MPDTKPGLAQEVTSMDSQNERRRRGWNVLRRSDGTPPSAQGLNRPLVIGHRGNCTVAPENSMAAFDGAWLAGADAIEIDVQQTRDGQAAIIHDATVDRTSDGSGAVASLTAQEISSLDGGSWFSPAFAGEKIPLLEDLIALMIRRPRFGLLVELKGRWADAPLRSVLSQIETAGLRPRTMVQSLDHQTLRSTREIDGTIAIGVTVDVVAPEHLKIAAELAATAIVARGVAMVTGSDPALPRIHGAGLQALAWSSNEPAEWDVMMRSGVDGMMSDGPDRLSGWISGAYPELA